MRFPHGSFIPPAYYPKVVEAVEATIKTEAGVLHSFSVGVPGTSVTMSVYDGVDDGGDPFWSGVLVAGQNVILDVAFQVACFVTLSGAAKVTFSYL